MASWDQLGELSNIAQLTGLDAVRLISLIVKSAQTARMHKRNCRQFAQHIRLIGNLLETLKLSELKKYPETREPLEQLEEALRRSYILVKGCQDKSYLYLLAMGWNIVYQFRKAQSEIDRYLKLVPLITLVDNARVRERLEYIEKDQCEYTFDEEEKQAQDLLLNPNPSQTVVLKKTLSCSYPNLPFDQALKKENEKLQIELHRSQSNMDVKQCEVIERLLGVTESVASVISEKDEKKGFCKEEKKVYSGREMEHCEEEKVYGNREEDYGNKGSNGSYVASRGLERHGDEWSADLLGCCSDPGLCLKTLFFPCGTFSKIASVAKNRPISSGQACNDLMGYTIILSCCCYTCCVRRKLRQMLNITGGCCDDFLSHLMCCCCALVQEWREIEIRGAHGLYKTKTSPPTS
ncbi:hypothetical protein LUZ60_015028 [Juncus effusus]|nr:hypothetical protein LUZ60_015028 [Juncus effusus]